MTEELSTKQRPDEICKTLGIGTTTYYNRLEHLGIEASKDEEGVYLNAEQMKRMEELHEHIKRTGKMKGFRGGGQLAVSESSGLASELEIPEVEAETFAQIDDEMLSQLIDEAGELRTQQIAMPHLVRLHLANNMTEDDLSDEQRAKLQAIREAANPKPNAVTVAQQLLERHRQNQGKK
ncbi:MAG: hypothetical protein JGK38_17355 [Microcoleus sp. PH2017_15_JOR_U_A]|uniref:hypothetical protein n=1 Tax=Microcoleus sp. PH2017_15_JOR_U_A TaxID=2798826 RepID=UPI001DDC08B4|nr:hypothetical protein [Microcoleus sp. PH2017_15_JOR_U_A]MCC3498365.1 hypothetical protein [Microcoleus sp. PH2017_15_JOR_U_A]MCC3509549.1 hypothetical protein [Microcoleus sp. PH2017_17_BER_D_A]